MTKRDLTLSFPGLSLLLATSAPRGSTAPRLGLPLAPSECPRSDPPIHLSSFSD
jgi:hypothetical protein